MGYRARIGTVDLRRDEERVFLRCSVCDIGTDFPLYGELANWTGRAFLYAHEHREQGYAVQAGEVATALAEMENVARVPAQQGWPVAEFSPFLTESSRQRVMTKHPRVARHDRATP